MTRIIIQRIQGSRLKDLARLIFKYRAPIIDRLWDRLSSIIEVDDDKVDELIAILNASPFVKYAEVDELLPPQFGTRQLWNQWYLSKIGAPNVWERTSGSEVTIAVLDSGVDSQHPDLARDIIPGYNVDGSYNSEPHGNAHGTQVAGCAAGNTADAGVRGVAFKAKIQPVKVSNRADGSAMISDLAKGLNWVASSGKARVANISYGAGQFKSVQHAARTLRNATEGLTFISAGNEGQNIVFDWSPDVIIVSATNRQDQLTSWSNYGPPVDCSAPGEGIVTTGLSGKIESVNGTSFSSPITAAAAALIMSYNADLTASEVEKILLETTKGPSKVVDIEAAIDSIGEPVDITPPTVNIISPKANSTVEGDLVVKVFATDDVELKHVDLYVDGEFMFRDDIAPHDFLVDTTLLSNGTHTIMAEAVDHVGNRDTFTTVILVDNAQKIEEDNDPPIVMIIAPQKLAWWRTTFTAQAYDDHPIKKMEILIDGKKCAEANSDTISVTQNTFFKRRVLVTVLAWDESENMGKVEEIIRR